VKTTRLEAFSDGVLAIIITIMVLELRAPHSPDIASLRPLLPVFLSYVLSFVYIGIYWNNHHHMLQVTERVNGGILWANLHLLFWLSLVPFVTAWMGENSFGSVPAALYGCVLLMAGVAYVILQRAILAEHGRDSVLARAIGPDLKGKISPVLYATAIAAAFWQPWISDALYVTTALIWLVPDRRIERAVAAKSLALLLLLGSSVAACSPRPALQWEEVGRLTSARDFFTLRARLDESAADHALPARFARALVEHAFNRPAESNETIAALLADPALPDSLATDLRRLQLDNNLRRFEYRGGLAHADALLADTTDLATAELSDVRNTRRIFAALLSTPPQTLVSRGETQLSLDDGRVPLTVNDSSRIFGFDTGANLPIIMRSEAKALGLRVIPAGLEVGTSTDVRVSADVAVAERLTIGALHYRNVPFLVFDDALLTFPDGFRIPGIIGFPVIEQMGEVRMETDGTVYVPAEPPTRQERNLALDGLSPLTRVRWEGNELLCLLDTGAGRSRFHQPFHLRFQRRVDSLSTPATRSTGGVGGMRSFPVRTLSNVRLEVGDTAIVLDSVDVLLPYIARTEAENYLDCSIGHDVLDSFSTYILNFRDMAFLLR
jgi:uncharacterized membrane protein